MFEPVQCGIERALLHLKDIAGELPDPPRDRPAMLRFELEGFQDQQVERALDEVDRLDDGLPMIIDTIARLVSIIKGSGRNRDSRLFAYLTTMLVNGGT